jgi:hypothetical protein
MLIGDSSFLMTTPDGRTWRIDVHGPCRIKATDINSPTGYHEWVSAEQAGVTFVPLRHAPHHG